MNNDSADKDQAAMQNWQQQLADLKTKYEGTVAVYVSNTLNFVGEVVFYLLGLACFVFPFIMKSVAPFHILKDITESDRILDVIPSRGEISTFDVAIKAVFILCGVLFVYLALKLKTIRQKNALLLKSAKLINGLHQYFSDKVSHQQKADTEIKGDLKMLEPKDIKL